MYLSRAVSASLRAREAFSKGEESDHFILLAAFQAWSLQRGNTFKWCEQNFINESTMRVIDGMRLQLISQLTSMGFLRTGRRENASSNASTLDEANCNCNNVHVIKAALCAGLYPNVARPHDPNSQWLSTRHERKVKVHNSSACALVKSGESVAKKIDADVSNTPLSWVIYNTITRYVLSHTRLVAFFK